MAKKERENSWTLSRRTAEKERSFVLLQKGSKRSRRRWLGREREREGKRVVDRVVDEKADEDEGYERSGGEGGKRGPRGTGANP